MSDRLLVVEGLQVTYYTAEASLEALHDVSFSVRAGEIVGVVGESGCGKSTLSASLMGVLPANGEITGGRIELGGRELRSLGTEQMRQLRGREIAMVFQDPMTSLNPTFTIGTQMVDVLRAHRGGAGGGGRELRRRAVSVLEQVGIPDAQERIDDFPHQFSGGMRQRVMIAMALMLEPGLLIADEVTSALDVTLEAQIVELLRRLRAEHGTAILFVSHDLGVIAQICDRVVVMYAGRAVEEGDVLSIFERPLHPYTRALLASVPSHRRRGERLASIPGRVPSLSSLPAGCKFANRCPYAQQVSREREPAYLEIDGRRVRCDMYDPASGWDHGAAPAGALPAEETVA
ncbi:MAG: ABC transporter ATP-binding protein [Actinobacteria bacterium]|nr:MAG: ABC transporter ATP-binding protein [Actinomycetota bacterium]